jgi:hypothetical protein
MDSGVIGHKYIINMSPNLPVTLHAVESFFTAMTKKDVYLGQERFVTRNFRYEINVELTSQIHLYHKSPVVLGRKL